MGKKKEKVFEVKTHRAYICICCFAHVPLSSHIQLLRGTDVFLGGSCAAQGVLLSALTVNILLALTRLPLCLCILLTHVCNICAWLSNHCLYKD